MLTAASQLHSEPFSGAVIVMGVAGCGKTTVGAALAKRLAVPFVEGDLLHPAANVAKMSAGTPLTDEDRWPWLGAVGRAIAVNSGVVASCSALKRAYREKLAQSAGRSISFVFLDGGRDVIAARMKARVGHFMPPALLDSQFAALERPGAGEGALAIDLALPLDAIVTRAAAFLTGVSQ